MLIPGLSNTDAENVFLGTTAAQAVYLGTTLVWPNVTGTPGVMGEQLITNPTNNAAGQYHVVSIPAAATKLDVVLIGGGGGGGDGGTLGPGEGGGCGAWQTATYTVGTDYPAGHLLEITVQAGGDGGTALTNTGGQRGGIAALLTKGGAVAMLSEGGKPNKAPDRSGATPPDCVFNGRTYRGGAGGTSANMNGVNGTAPGGGGQGGGVEVNGNNGGKGGSGGCYLFFY